MIFSLPPFGQFGPRVQLYSIKLAAPHDDEGRDRYSQRKPCNIEDTGHVFDVGNDQNPIITFLTRHLDASPSSWDHVLIAHNHIYFAARVGLVMRPGVAKSKECREDERPDRACFPSHCKLYQPEL